MEDDFEALEQLQFDKKYAPWIGIFSLKKHLLELTWKKYYSAIPELLKRLRAFKRTSEESLQKVQSQLSSIDAIKLRGMAARYVMLLLQNIEKLLSGTLEGNPSVNGQTLLEEKSQDDTGEWLDNEYRQIPFDASSLPYSESKLYGGQQFERLLTEFKAVANQITFPKITMDDLATAAGPRKLNNPSNCAWAASDLARGQIQKQLLPLLEQLFKRASYIMKRLVSIVDSMIEANRRHKKRNGKDVDQDDVEDFTFFTNAVKDLYFKFVDQTAEECKKKCKDEFYSTRLIYWELSTLDTKSLAPSTSNKEDIKKTVLSLATELFNKIRARIIKNILLKSYNFFLVPMTNDLWGEIQSNITCLTDEQLEELFEFNATRERLKDTEKDMLQVMATFANKENLFMKYANTFSQGSPKEWNELNLI